MNSCAATPSFRTSPAPWHEIGHARSTLAGVRRIICCASGRFDRSRRKERKNFRVSSTAIGWSTCKLGNTMIVAHTRLDTLNSRSVDPCWQGTANTEVARPKQWERMMSTVQFPIHHLRRDVLEKFFEHHQLARYQLSASHKPRTASMLRTDNANGASVHDADLESPAC